MILSNGSETKVGATFAPWERFGDWKRIDDEAEPGVVSLETAIRGRVRTGTAARPRRELRRLPRAAGRAGQGAGAEPPGARRERRDRRAAVESQTREGRLGVFWHTQGSGKSLSMLFFTQKVLRHEPGNWTFVMVTDRTELDDQLYGEFKDAGVVDGQVQATSSAHLRQLLGEDHRYVFTLIHKFRPEPGEDDAGLLGAPTTSSSSPTRRTAASTRRSRSTCASRCRTRASSASPARR